MSALVSITTPKGSVVHLAAEGERRTLCGREHLLNARLVRQGGPYVGPAADATCPKCLAFESRIHA